LIRIEAPSSADRRGTVGAGETPDRSGGALRRFSTKPPQTYGGIGLHARTLDVCTLHQAGERLIHQKMNARPDTWRRTMAPDREEIVVAVAGRFTWDLAC
jgi:hypothetical protein